MSGLGVAALLLGTWTFVTLIASLGSLESEGRNNALPMLWVLAAVGWIAFTAVAMTLRATGQLA